jgi:Domain of Unknown Function (DUF1206)
MDQHDVRHAAHRAGDSTVLEGAARVGYAVSGLLHLLIGWLALQVAWGLGGGAQSADQSGALQTLAGNSLGRILLWLAVAGFLGLGIWQLTEAVLRSSGSDDKKVWASRGKALGKAVLYLALAWTAFRFARGSSSDSESQTLDFTASLMSRPGGRILVGVVGLVVLGIAIYHGYKGATNKFLEDLDENPGTWATRAGAVGYLAKGLALAVVGVLFLVAAVQGQAKEASGLDGALRTLRDQAFGPFLLSAVAIGFAAYGLYSFSRARHAKV